MAYRVYTPVALSLSSKVATPRTLFLQNECFYILLTVYYSTTD